MAQVPSGTTFWVATLFSTVRPTTVVTNALEAVVTAAGHGFNNGDIVEMTSGWGRLNKRAYRIKSVTTDTFVLERCNTSNTNFYPLGGGLGSVRKVSTWQQITMVLGVGGQGGQAKLVEYQYMEDDVARNINNGFSATSKDLTLDADALGTAGYEALVALTEVQSDTIVRIVSKNGAIQLVPATVALNEDVQMQNDQINRVTCSLSGNNRAVRYPAP